MPRKNIYIKDADTELFERAEKLAGEENLSGTIAEAIKLFVEAEEAKATGMEEHTLEVGIWRTEGTDDTRKVKFIGRKLADGTEYTGQTSDRRDRWTEYRIYQSKAGQVIVFWRHNTCWQGEADRADYAVLDSLPGYDNNVFGRLDEEGYPQRLPGDVLQEAAKSLGRELVEYIE